MKTAPLPLTTLCGASGVIVPLAAADGVTVKLTVAVAVPLSDTLDGVNAAAGVVLGDRVPLKLPTLVELKTMRCVQLPPAASENRTTPQLPPATALKREPRDRLLMAIAVAVGLLKVTICAALVAVTVAL